MRDLSRPTLLLLALTSAALLAGCGSSKPSAAAGTGGDLPEICRGYDFRADPSMADACGMRETRYKSYKNIPTQRYLILPKDASLVLNRQTQTVELRLPNTMPADLGRAAADQVDFSDAAKTASLKNQYIYKELYPAGGARVRMFKMRVPSKEGGLLDFCFRVPEPAATSNDRSRTSRGHSLDALECGEFDALVAANGG